ncbi:MAG: SDR family oxidoreductase [Chloroflexi bacterium]|nr:SDR family oxidoreductase [Chloroflexota bacterium]
MKLDGKVAIVTGSGQGIGREIALAYAEQGADIIVAEHNVSTMEAVAREISALGRKVLAVTTDVTDEEMVKRMVDHTIREFGRIDILVNNAGGPLEFHLRPVWEVPLKEWQTVIAVNLTGTFLCSSVVIPQMIKQRSGIIINISSGQGRRGTKGYGAYSSAKFAVEGLTQVLAIELTPYNVRVNALRPGGVTATPIILRKTDIANSMPTLARPDIVRPLALFLASDDSAGITGQSIDCREWNPAHGFGDFSQYLYSSGRS